MAADAPEFGTFTRVRVERIIGIAVALGCLALGAQALLASFDPAAEHPGWHPLLEIIVFVPLALMVGACLLGRGERFFGCAFGITFTIGVALWPVAAAGIPFGSDEEPWTFYLINVATVASVIALPLAGQIAVTAALPLVWGISRLVQGGVASDMCVIVIMDVTFAWILGGVLVTIAWVFRSAAAAVDQARAAAIAVSAAAAETEATEAERVEVGALMHDRVLAALIAAERADSPRERALAVDMAGDALTGLADADSDRRAEDSAPVGVRAVADGIRRLAADAGHPVVVRLDSTCTTAWLPGAVARAVELAAAQAVANAVEHAAGRGLTVRVDGDSARERIAVTVADTGDGFDLAAVPADRIGLRASIIARMTAAGGRADIASSPAGTVVMLTWEPRP